MKLFIVAILTSIAICVYAQDTCSHLSDGSRVMDVDVHIVYGHFEDSTIMYSRWDFYTKCKKCGIYYKIDYKQQSFIIWKRDE